MEVRYHMEGERSKEGGSILIWKEERDRYECDIWMYLMLYRMVEEEISCIYSN